jgi:hypothetical protein
MSSLPGITDATVLEYDQQKLAGIFAAVLQKNTTAQTWDWLHQASVKINEGQTLMMAFTQTPRKTGRAVCRITEDEAALLKELVPEFVFRGWTVDRWARVCLLVQLDVTDNNKYIGKIENLFDGAEINEQVALYGALPLLAYPQQWVSRCAEGIRSNVADVLQSIMCYNPYPARHLGEAAWNQMVLKAFFTEKHIEQIIGLDERANPQLASILVDYAHERWAAHRTVNPLLWRCVSPFINAENFGDIERVFHSENEVEVAAAALACNNSSYPPAAALVNGNSHLKNLIETGVVTWDTIAGNKVAF